MALMRYGTLVAAIILIAVAIGMIIVAAGFTQPRTLGSPGPARLPMIYGTLLALVGGGLIYRTFAGLREPGLKIEGTPRALGLAAGSALCIYLWSFLDFLVLFIPATFIGVRLLGAGWAGSTLTALILPGAVYGVFGILLNVPFP